MLKKGKQSIDDLPGKELFLGFKQNYLDYVFGIVNLADVTEKARQYCYLDRDDREFEPDPDDLHHDFEADDDEP